MTSRVAFRLRIKEMDPSSALAISLMLFYWPVAAFILKAVVCFLPLLSQVRVSSVLHAMT